MSNEKGEAPVSTCVNVSEGLLGLLGLTNLFRNPDAVFTDVERDGKIPIRIWGTVVYEFDPAADSFLYNEIFDDCAISLKVHEEHDEEETEKIYYLLYSLLTVEPYVHCLKILGIERTRVKKGE